MAIDRDSKILNFIKYQTNSGNGFPAVDKVAQHLGVNPESARDAMLQMAARGEIEIAARHPHGRGWRHEFKMPSKDE